MLVLILLQIVLVLLDLGRARPHGLGPLWEIIRLVERGQTLAMIVFDGHRHLHLRRTHRDELDKEQRYQALLLGHRQYGGLADRQNVRVVGWHGKTERNVPPPRKFDWGCSS